MFKRSALVGLPTLMAAALAIITLTGCGSRPAAFVNGTKITEGDFTKRLREEAGAPILAGMIDEILIRDAFQAAGLTLTPEEVNQTLQDNFGSPEQFEQWAAQNEMDPDNYRERVVEPKMMLDKLATKDVVVTDEDLKAFYQEHQQRYDVPDRVSLRQILVPQKADADKVMAALKGGADFATVVRQYSMDAQTRETGGLVPDIPVQTLPQPLDEVLANLKEGEYSQPLDVGRAWLIIKLEKRTAGEKRTLAQVESQVRDDYLQSKRSQQAVLDLRKQLRQEAKVQIIAEELQSLQELYRNMEVPAVAPAPTPGAEQPSPEAAPPAEPTAPEPKSPEAPPTE